MKLNKHDADAAFELIDEWECKRQTGNPTYDLIEKRTSVHFLHPDLDLIPHKASANDTNGWTDIFVSLGLPLWNKVINSPVYGEKLANTFTQ